MTAVAFDTHKFIKELKNSGLPEGQAEALQHAFSEAIGANLATKDDIKDIKFDIERLEHKIDSHRQETKSDIDSYRQETKSDIDSYRQETKSNIERLEHKVKSDIERREHQMKILTHETKGDIERSEQRVTIRLGSIMVIGIGVLAAVIKFL